jgi:hypothetical protein
MRQALHITLPFGHIATLDNKTFHFMRSDDLNRTATFDTPTMLTLKLFCA